MMPSWKALSTGLVGLVLTFGSLFAAEDLVWPRQPAEPLVRWDSAVRSLDGFEVAVHGPLTEPARLAQKLKRPSGLAFDARGRLLISDARLGLLLQIDPDLGVVLIFGSGTDPRLEEPMGVAAHSNGNIYVADASLQQVVGFDGRGTVVATYGLGVLEEPVDVAISPDGARLFVADAQADRVVVFDIAQGGEIGSFGQRGKGAAEFYLPTAVEFDGAGQLMVVDQLNSRVQIFGADGSFTRALNADRATGFSRPRDVAVDGAGRIYLTDSAQSRVQIYNRDLEPLLALGRNGMGDGEFLGVGAIAISGDRLAVLDRAGGRVQLFHLFGVEPRTAPRREIQPVATAVAAATPAEATTEAAAAPGPREMPEPRLPLPKPSRREPAVAESPPEAIVVEDLSEEPMANTATPEESVAERTIIEEPVAAAEPNDDARTAQEILERVTAWARAWQEQDPDRYLDFYAEDFEPGDGITREAWAAQRRERLTAPLSIEVATDIVETRIGETGAEVIFLQSYSSDRFSDRVRKSLRFARRDGVWKILRETVLDAR